MGTSLPHLVPGAASGTFPALVKHGLVGQNDDKDGMPPLRMENSPMSLTTSSAAEVAAQKSTSGERRLHSSFASAEGGPSITHIMARSREVLTQSSNIPTPACLEYNLVKSGEAQVLALNLVLETGRKWKSQFSYN